MAFQVVLTFHDTLSWHCLLTVSLVLKTNLCLDLCINSALSTTIESILFFGTFFTMQLMLEDSLQTEYIQAHTLAVPLEIGCLCIKRFSFLFVFKEM